MIVDDSSFNVELPIHLLDIEIIVRKRQTGKSTSHNYDNIGKLLNQTCKKKKFRKRREEIGGQLNEEMEREKLSGKNKNTNLKLTHQI